MPTTRRERHWRQRMEETRLALASADSHFELVGEFGPKGDQPAAGASRQRASLRSLSVRSGLEPAAVIGRCGPIGNGKPERDISQRGL